MVYWTPSTSSDFKDTALNNTDTCWGVVTMQQRYSVPQAWAWLRSCSLPLVACARSKASSLHPLGQVVCQEIEIYPRCLKTPKFSQDNSQLKDEGMW